MRVLKFGGAALKDGDAVRRAAEIVRSHGGSKPLVVVSAHEGVTELLTMAAVDAERGIFQTDPLRIRHRTLLHQLDLPAELLDRYLAQLFTVLRSVCDERRLDRRRRDFLLSFGERMSARIVAATLRAAGVPATPVDAFDLGLQSERRSGLTLPQESARERVRAAVMEVPGVPVVTGFIALDAEGHVTTLGRNGSDLTAVWLGGAVGAEEVHLWKTVDAVCTADPTVVPTARCIANLSYLAAAELALHGASILHPAAMEPAQRSNMPVRVRPVGDPGGPGTTIGPLSDPGHERPLDPLALAHRRRVALITHRLDLGRDPGAQMTQLHTACREAGLDPYLFAVPGAEAVLLLPDPPLDEAQGDALARLAVDATLERGLASFALVGHGVADDPGVVPRVVDLLQRAGLEARSLPAGDGPMSRLFLTDAESLDSALRLVHAGLIESDAGLQGQRRTAR